VDSWQVAAVEPVQSSASSSVAISIENHSLLFRPLFISGCIFHILPTSNHGDNRVTSSRQRAGMSMSDSTPCCEYEFGTPPTVVYPASRHGFSELIVSPHMFADHMPNRYLDCLQMLVPDVPRM
jgi:hypothetical protein